MKLSEEPFSSIAKQLGIDYERVKDMSMTFDDDGITVKCEFRIVYDEDSTQEIAH